MSVTLPFDTSQPGALRLRELARRITADLLPVTVEIVKPVLLIDEGRRTLRPGERATLAARTAEHLVAEGSAIRC
jgi:hypothetical protein